MRLTEWEDHGRFVDFDTTTAKALVPIVDWQNTQSPADVNKSAEGKFVYIKYDR
jgi:hypothetical protein